MALLLLLLLLVLVLVQFFTRLDVLWSRHIVE